MISKSYLAKNDVQCSLTIKTILFRDGQYLFVPSCCLFRVTQRTFSNFIGELERSQIIETRQMAVAVVLVASCFDHQNNCQDISLLERYSSAQEPITHEIYDGRRGTVSFLTNRRPPRHSPSRTRCSELKSEKRQDTLSPYRRI